MTTIEDAAVVLKVWRLIEKTGIGKKTLAGVRSRIIWGSLSHLHQKFAHQLRDFAVGTNAADMGLNPKGLSHLANACRDVVCQFLEVQPEHVHSTLKLIGPSPDADKWNAPVYTVTRSSPLNRSPQINIPHLAGHNSDFSALLGCSDRKNHWTEPYSAFTCPDLTASHASYDCSRENWDRCYRTIVLPLRYADPHSLEHQFMGFLTFDSLRPKIFGSLPDIFEHQNHRRDEFNEKLSKCPLIHLTGLMADSLAAIFFLLFRTQPQPPASAIQLP